MSDEQFMQQVEEMEDEAEKRQGEKKRVLVSEILYFIEIERNIFSLKIHIIFLK